MIEHRFRVARKLYVTMRWDGDAIHVEWDPAMPTRMNRVMLRNYRKGRGEFMDMVAAIRGFSVVVEPDEGIFEHRPTVH